MFHVSELPSLRYFRIFIGRYSLPALVDSGSSRTLFGDESIEVVRRLNLPTDLPKNFRIRIANKWQELERRFPLQLRDESREISVCLLPRLAVPCIVGVDFLHAFGVSLDFASSEWHFTDRPRERYTFENIRGEDLSVCSGLPELSRDQEQRLARFLKDKIPEVVENPGVTSLIGT